jgi:hypothetical protein
MPVPAELDRVTVPQVAGEEHSHAGLTANALPQVDDQRVSGGEQAHRGGDDVTAGDGREKDRLQVQVADVAREALRAGNATAGLVGPSGHHRVLLGVIPGRAGRQGLLVVEQPQVLVTVNRLQVSGDRLGQRRRVGGIPPGSQPFGQHAGHLGSDVREDVVSFDQVADLGNHIGRVSLVLRHVFGHTVKETKLLM